MLNIVSILIGLVAAVMAIFSLLPFFGWGNWLMLPIAVIGLIVGALSSKTTGRNLNLVVILIGVVRLSLGGGIFLIGEAETRKGVVYGLSAYLLWGFLPIYFKLLGGVLPTEIVAQRVLWSVLLLAGLVIGLKRWPLLRAALLNPQALKLLAASSLLIGVNWLVYISAIGANHVLETSLGYFLNPLVNVLMGVLILKERLTRAQGAAVRLAAIGVAILAAGAASGLWISLALAATFATYGLLRKVAPVDSLEGLAIETVMLAPVAAVYLLWLGPAASFGDGAGVTALLALGGVVTATPLLLFAAAARRLRYATLGLLQYVAPTIQFLLAVLAFGEPLTTAHLVCFAFIWTGLAVYAADGLRRRPARVAARA